MYCLKIDLMRNSFNFLIFKYKKLKIIKCYKLNSKRENRNYNCLININCIKN